MFKMFADCKLFFAALGVEKIHEILDKITGKVHRMSTQNWKISKSINSNLDNIQKFGTLTGTMSQRVQSPWLSQGRDLSYSTCPHSKHLVCHLAYLVGY